MIIVDFSQVMYSNIFIQMGFNHEAAGLEESMVRHSILNSLRSYKMKFGSEYGEMIITADSRRYWRREAFPHYKANRKKHVAKGTVDWKLIFSYMDTVKAEIKAFLPYRVLEEDGAEADDVIAALVHYSHDDILGFSREPILILSGDHDFIQLQTNPDVKQYDPVHKKWVADKDPARYLLEHVLRGDVGDGIPNVLSDDDTFVTDKRQKPLSQKRIDAIIATFRAEKPVTNDDFVEYVYDNWLRNKILIDLAYVPVDLQVRIMQSYKKQAGKTRSGLLPYFMKYKLKNLMEAVSDF